MVIDATRTLDPVTLEVIRNALPAISDEMSYDLQRTSYNMMIYEVRDYCTALLDTEGKLISQNIGGVSHFVADLGVVVKDGIRQYGLEGFAPGDVLLHNHQAVAGLEHTGLRPRLPAADLFLGRLGIVPAIAQLCPRGRGLFGRWAERVAARKRTGGNRPGGAGDLRRLQEPVQLAIPAGAHHQPVGCSSTSSLEERSAAPRKPTSSSAT